jgi:hypothetical protein
MRRRRKETATPPFFFLLISSPFFFSDTYLLFCWLVLVNFGVGGGGNGVR